MNVKYVYEKCTLHSFSYTYTYTNTYTYTYTYIYTYIYIYTCTYTYIYSSVNSVKYVYEKMHCTFFFLYSLFIFLVSKYAKI